jgi:hypothetical protein
MTSKTVYSVTNILILRRAMNTLRNIIFYVALISSSAISQTLTSVGETTTFKVGNERIPFPGLSIVLESESCIRFFWTQYSNTYNDLTLAEAEQKSKDMIADRFTETNCYVPANNITRVETINSITQAIRERKFEVTYEDGDQLSLWQFWYREDDGENLTLFYHYGSDDNILLLVGTETYLAKKRSNLDQYLIEVVSEVDLKLLLGDENTEFEKDCTENYPLEGKPYNAEPLYLLESCEVTVTWRDNGEYYVSAILREAEVGELTYSTNLEGF